MSLKVDRFVIRKRGSEKVKLILTKTSVRVRPSQVRLLKIGVLLQILVPYSNSSVPQKITSQVCREQQKVEDHRQKMCESIHIISYTYLFNIRSKVKTDQRSEKFQYK
jgi:hypothetical protein